MSETVTRTCPACENTYEGLNADADHWYCESKFCQVVFFGPKGYWDDDTELNADNE